MNIALPAPTPATNAQFRLNHYSTMMLDFTEPEWILNPFNDDGPIDIADTSLTLYESLNTDFDTLYYDMVFFRLPTWTAQVQTVIQNTWDSLRYNGYFCVYAKPDDYSNLEVLLGVRTTQVPIVEHDEIIFVWVK